MSFKRQSLLFYLLLLCAVFCYGPPASAATGGYLSTDAQTTGNFWSIANGFIYGSHGYMLCGWRTDRDYVNLNPVAKAANISAFVNSVTTHATWQNWDYKNFSKPSQYPIYPLQELAWRNAGHWYKQDSTNTWRIQVRLLDPQDSTPHQIHFYCYDKNNQGISQTIQLVQPDTTTEIASQAVGGFSSGKWVNFCFTGDIDIRVIGENSSISAIAFDNGRLPAATMVNPADETKIPVGSSITLQATASDPDDSISKVEFYYTTAGSDVKIADATLNNGVYEYTWHNVPEGIYDIKARAYDDWKNWMDSDNSVKRVYAYQVNITSMPTLCPGGKNDSLHQGILIARATAKGTPIAGVKLEFGFNAPVAVLSALDRPSYADTSDITDICGYASTTLTSGLLKLPSDTGLPGANAKAVIKVNGVEIPGASSNLSIPLPSMSFDIFETGTDIPVEDQYSFGDVVDLKGDMEFDSNKIINHDVIWNFKFWETEDPPTDSETEVATFEGVASAMDPDNPDYFLYGAIIPGPIIDGKYTASFISGTRTGWLYFYMIDNDAEYEAKD